MTEGEQQVTHQLFLAGQLLGTILKAGSAREIKELVKQIDPDVLQAYLETKPEGFIYSEQIQQTIRLARTFKSFGKG